MFFLAVAWLQLAWALAVARHPSPLTYRLGIVLNAGIIAVWLVSRTIGIDGQTEAIGFPDAVATALEAVVVLGSIGPLARLLPKRPVRDLTSGAVLGASAALIAGLVSVGMVPSLSGHEEAAGHHGEAGASSEVAAATGADHHATTGDAPATPAAAHTDAASHTDAAADEPEVAVPYDPELPIDLGGIDGVTPQQQAEAENIVATTLLGLPQWTDPADAEAAGFRSIGDGGTGIEHLVNQAFMDDDVILDPDKPESLVFDTSAGGRKLVAAMYMLKRGTPLDEAPTLGGDLMQWHVHQDLCYNAQGKVAGLVKADGTCPAGLVKPEETPMIHVWIEPHPCGPFAALEGIGAGAIAEGEERLCDTAHGGH